MSSRPRSASEASTAIATGCVSVILMSIVGLILGVVIGSQVAFHENDGAKQTLYVAGETSALSPDLPPFRIMTYDEHDQPTLRMIDYREHELDEGRLGIPVWDRPKSAGPWGEAGPLAEHSYQAGGVEFTASSDSVAVRLILYPSNPANGWVREYYFYTVRDRLITPVRMERERSFNGWGIEQTAMFAFFGLGGGVIAGLLIWAIISTVSADRRIMTD